MGLSLIKSPNQKGNCLNSVYDCLEVVVEATDLIQDKGAKDRACFQINEALDIGDKITFFEGTEAEITFEVVAPDDIGTLKCRRTDRICVPQVQTIQEQVSLLLFELQKRPVFVDDYIITLIETEGEAPIICIEAKEIGKPTNPLSFTESSIVSPLGVITTHLPSHPNQSGKNIELLSNYEVFFYIYCKEVSVKDGVILKEWKQVWKSLPRPFFLTKNPVGNYIPYEIQEVAKRLVRSEFQWDDNNNSIPGLHILDTLTKEIEVRASSQYTIEFNGKKETVKSDILPIGAKFPIINASLPPWANSFSRFCDCLGQVDGIETSLYSTYPDGIEVAECGVLPLQVFICVPSTGMAAGVGIGAWYVDVFWANGSVSQGLKLTDIDIKESSVLQYNLDLQNDAAIIEAAPTLLDNCNSNIDYLLTYVVINAEGNPLDFSVACKYNEGNEDYNIVFTPDGLSVFAGHSLGYEWAMSQEGEVWEVFSSSEIGIIDMDGDDILARIIRLRVTTPLSESCVLEVQRDIVAGGCRVWSGFDLETSYTGNASLCHDFTQNNFDVSLQKQGDTWVAFFDIGAIVTEMNYSNAFNKYIRHGINGNYTDKRTFLLDGIAVGETIDYELTVSFEYGGNLIVRTFNKTYTAPDGIANIQETLPCEDKTGDTGVSINLIDNSLGGGQITSKGHYYAFAPRQWDFETQIKPILQPYDFASTPLAVSFESQYLYSSTHVLWIAQIIEGCNGEKFSYRQLEFDCEQPQQQYLIAGNCKGLDIEVTGTSGQAPRILTSAVSSPNGHHEIKLIAPDGEKLISIQSTEENTTPYLDTSEFEGVSLASGRYEVVVTTADNCSIKRYVELLTSSATCNSPKEVVVTPTKEGKAFVQWSPVQGAIYYKVRYIRKDKDGAEWVTYKNGNERVADGNPVTNSVFIDKKLDNCGLYQFEVTTICEAGQVASPVYSEVTEMYCCDPCIDPCKDCGDSSNPPNEITAPPMYVGDFEVTGIMQCVELEEAGNFEVVPICTSEVQSTGDFEVTPICNSAEVQSAGSFEAWNICAPDVENCDTNWGVEEV